ncbi:nitrilase [Cercophora scortea]|uniref:Nitrilase n=1 Tax=Cercophora scortea TaxID=314031 RepID=A0AAE0MIC3_9PEZI|nr:nitrilase [Cercophora scortea]
MCKPYIQAWDGCNHYAHKPKAPEKCGKETCLGPKGFVHDDAGSWKTNSTDYNIEKSSGKCSDCVEREKKPDLYVTPKPGRKRNAPGDGNPFARTTRATAASQRSQRNAAAARSAVPDVYREMLREARAEVVAQGPSSSSDRPLKRKRPGEKKIPNAAAAPKEEEPPMSAARSGVDDGNDDDGDIGFEDVVLPPATVQTMVMPSDDDDDDDEALFEDVEIHRGVTSAVPAASESRELTLNLTAQEALMAPRRSADRRKNLSKEAKERRVEIHKMHLLCLLSHVELRNQWCNDQKVQDLLRPLLSEKMTKFLNPRASLTQYGQAESLKSGIHEASIMFKTKFKITERGLRRALWAEDEEQLKNYQLPDDIESAHEKQDFIEAAKTLSGSRDVGAQLFCALLRSAGVETRLVCSLQPLACVPGGPTLPKQQPKIDTPSKPSKGEIYAAAMAKYETKGPDPGATPSPRRRLGHPLAAAYHVPSMTAPVPSPSRPETPQVKRIRGESPYPIYWVEVLDRAYQKWHPVDALVTGTQWKPRALEPPASDRENCMTYVVAFEADGSARDVTRRYAKAYNSKTKRLRIDGIRTGGTAGSGLSGERWWRRAMRKYARPWPTDLDQIEKTELAAEEAKEPMPRNVADFKDHPVYALERHLRRNEVLVPGAQTTGTVGAGSKAPLERIYRRRDVRIARSREKWYRMGREVKPGEEPVVILPKRTPKRGGFNDYNDDNEDNDDDELLDKGDLFGDSAAAAAGTPIYTEDQTDLYQAPPVRNGRVPKNKFGNIDLYVPSMVPAGGAHVAHERAAQAAYVLGVDYAPALTGFQFKGRQGTAVLHGVVVPAECEEGVWAVIGGLTDLDAEMERERRARRAVRMWSRFLKGLRIRERIWAGAVEGEEEGKREGEDGEGKGKGNMIDDGGDEDVDMAGVASDVSEEYFMGEDEEGGGFLIE